MSRRRLPTQGPAADRPPQAGEARVLPVAPTPAGAASVLPDAPSPAGAAPVRPGPTDRRPALVAVGLLLLGAGLVLVCAAASWVSVRIAGVGGLGTASTVGVRLRGSALDPSGVALGLLGLAAVAAVPATRGRVRSVVGVLVVLAACAVVVAAVRVGVDPLRAARGSSQVRAAAAGDGGVRSAAGSAWPWLEAAGGVAMLAAGLLVAVRGHRWPALSGRYDNPAARAAEAGQALPPQQRGGPAPAQAATEDGRRQWELLERGEDPTL